ncbi:hypothetical protein TARUN_8234 [Trichoderma arundinaceum]|uniref:Uncharacterized protein n=1 Tax=Trichoderma arundinaceum TaxID=490622 RepID=A0A395ND19_TRIAR|nr:hypothetical protein TARUN_8234 [Trichoderma arundinaceum]
MGGRATSGTQLLGASMNAPPLILNPFSPSGWHKPGRVVKTDELVLRNPLSSTTPRPVSGTVSFLPSGPHAVLKHRRLLASPKPPGAQQPKAVDLRAFGWWCGDESRPEWLVRCRRAPPSGVATANQRASSLVA